MNTIKGISSKKPRTDLEVLFDRNVFSFILYELAKHGDVEEGGKYIGYLVSPNDSTVNRCEFRPDVQSIVITDFLPSGPKANRIRTSFMPDGEYQEAIFRKSERLDQEIEHVGTWHSHHCNGLQTLSGRDIEGYFKTVNKANYRLDCFIASLIKHIPNDPEEDGWIDHFLFIRGESEYYRITDQAKVIEWATIFGSYTEHNVQDKGSAVCSVTAEVSGEVPSLWYKTKEGQRVLADDKRFFDEQFEARVVATLRKDSRITITGRRGNKAVVVIYPHSQADEDISILIRVDAATVLQMQCEPNYRQAGYAAALTALTAV